MHDIPRIAMCGYCRKYCNKYTVIEHTMYEWEGIKAIPSGMKLSIKCNKCCEKEKICVEKKT